MLQQYYYVACEKGFSQSRQVRQGAIQGKIQKSKPITAQAYYYFMALLLKGVILTLSTKRLKVSRTPLGTEWSRAFPPGLSHLMLEDAKAGQRLLCLRITRRRVFVLRTIEYQTDANADSTEATVDLNE